MTTSDLDGWENLSQPEQEALQDEYIAISLALKEKMGEEDYLDFVYRNGVVPDPRMGD